MPFAWCCFLLELGRCSQIESVVVERIETRRGSIATSRWLETGLLDHRQMENPLLRNPAAWSRRA